MDFSRNYNYGSNGITEYSVNHISFKNNMTVNRNGDNPEKLFGTFNLYLSGVFIVL